MYAEDFEYDGRYLSDYNFIICNFGDKGIENISGGSDISFNKVMREQGKIYGLSGTQYGECLECSFQICKNPCIYNDYGIDNEEYREIMRWLNRREFLPFKPFNGETGGNEEIWFNGSFNINKLIMNGKTYGLELTLVTDKPFGYGKEISKIFGFTAGNQIKVFTDTSDEIGITYPDMKIRCMSSGDLTIENTTYPCSTVIKNCSYGEIINITGGTKIITTSLADHDIADDFNYEFFKVENKFGQRDNKIRVSMPCEIKMSYYPIIKDTP